MDSKVDGNRAVVLTHLKRKSDDGNGEAEFPEKLTGHIRSPNSALDMGEKLPEVKFSNINGKNDSKEEYEIDYNPVRSDDGDEYNDDADDNGKEKRGFLCCGRGKKRPKMEMVGSLELFKFSSPFDKILMFVGTIWAMVQGCAIPTNLAVFGEIINVFIDFEAENVTIINGTEFRETDLVDEIKPYIYLFIGIGVGSLLSGFVSIWCWSWTAERQVSVMRKRFFKAVMNQDIGWFDLHEAGEISSRFSEDVTKISEGMGDKMAIFIQWTTTWLAAYLVAFTRSWKLTMAVIPFSPICMLIGALAVRIMRRMAVKEAKAYAKAGAIAEQAFRGIRTVQAFQGQEKETKRYESNLSSAVKVGSRKGLAFGVSNSFFWFVLLIMFACVMWFGTWLIQNDGLRAGRILPVFFGIMIGSVSLGQAFNNLESFSNARGAATKVFAIIDLVPSIDAFSTEGLKPKSLFGRIEFKNVRFNYPGRKDVTVLEGLSFSIEPGQHVALVGPSGCGKSTTVQLLQRFYDPLEGSVSIDGNDIRDLNLRWLREHIGVVSQEPVLFDKSIEENIRFGKMDATTEEIHQAAKMANAHDFIQVLPEGYNTNVGERGAQLSGGQKQRICIARALVRNPKILLLDEATSALDHESEAVVQSALEKAEKGRTTITIAHRLSTVRNADKILVISEGEVLESGTHDDLIQQEGLYYHLVKIQTKLEKDSELDIEDVEIIEEGDEDDDGDTALEALLRRSFSRSPSEISEKEEKQVNLVVRPSLRTSKTKRQNSHAHADKVNLPEVPDGQEDRAVSLKEIMRYNSQEWHLIVMGCFGALIAGSIHPCFAFILSEFIKSFGEGDKDEQWNHVNILAGSVIGVAFVSAFARLLQGYAFSKSGAYLTARLRKLAFSSILNQDMKYFDRPQNQVGLLASKLSGDAALVQGATGSKIGQILESLSTIGCAVTIAFVFGWKLALVVLSIMPLMVISGIVQGKVLAGAAQKDKSQLQQAGRICSEVVDSIRTVAALGREDYFLEKFNYLIDYTKSSHKKRSIVFGATYGFSQCLIFFAYAVAFYYGGTLIADGEMQFYNVFRVFGAIIFGGMMVGRASSFGVDYTKAKLAAGRIISTIHHKPNIDIREDSGTTLTSFQGSIQLQNAVFFYESRPNTAVLDDLSLEVAPGKSVALVGASGCGKSTTIQLVERFYDVNSGVVTADGHDIRKMNLRWFRQQLGIVSQEPTLFDCSIAENIAYGDNSRVVPMAEIVQAAKDANIHTFISSLPRGYDTSVGEKGAQLSGGQKQRVAIARALVRNPKILLLDEATSALDTESEKIVQDALDRASKDRTCITIAHRLSTIQNCDKIAVLSKGKILEIGSHQQLMTIKGAYYRLQKAQNKSHSNTDL